MLSEYKYNINLSDLPMLKKAKFKKCEFVFVIFQITITR